MLTEASFREGFERALVLRRQGAPAAAGEVLFQLFDDGRTVGGFGVTRLSFVLRELAALAEPANPGRGLAAQQVLDGLAARRAQRERAVLAGAATFVEVQELIALNEALGEAARSTALAGELARARPELGDAAGRADAAAALRFLLFDQTLPADPEELADRMLGEGLKRAILELAAALASADAPPAAAAPTGVSATGGAAAARLAVELRNRVDGLRVFGELPRDRQDKRRLAALAADVADILERRGDQPRELAGALAEMIERHHIRADEIADRELLSHLVRRARHVARLIAEHRLDEDFADPSGPPPAGYDTALESQILRQGMEVYEVLVRIDQQQLAERMESWLLAFRQTESVYDAMVAAVRRARRPDLEGRLQQAARRLQIG